MHLSENDHPIAMHFHFFFYIMIVHGIEAHMPFVALLVGGLVLASLVVANLTYDKIILQQRVQFEVVVFNKQSSTR